MKGIGWGEWKATARLLKGKGWVAQMHVPVDKQTNDVYRDIMVWTRSTHTTGKWYAAVRNAARAAQYQTARSCSNERQVST